MKKIKWGVIGTASIAAGCTIPGMKKAKNCDLYAIAGRDIQKAKEFKKKFGFKKAYGDYQAILDDPKVEAVYIPLPNNLHYEWALKALNAGKHVLCEKPLVPTEKMAVELFEAAENNHVFLMEAFAYLHSPYVESLKQVLDSQVLGEIRYMESAFITQTPPETDIRMVKEMYGGAMYDLGCYCLSIILRLLNRKPDEIKSLATFSDKGIDTYSTALMKFGDISTAIRCGMVLGNTHNGRMDSLFIYGDKGYLKSEVEFNQEGKLSFWVYSDEGKKKYTVSALQNYRLEVEQLGKSIQYLKDKEKGVQSEPVSPLVDADYSIMEAQVLEQIVASFSESV